MKHRLEIEWETTSNYRMPIPEEAQNALIEEALGRAHKLQREGYISGELHSEVDGVAYSGWWKLRELCEKDDEQPVAPPAPSALERFMALWNKYCLSDKNCVLEMGTTGINDRHVSLRSVVFDEGVSMRRRYFAYAEGYGRTTEEACEAALHNYEQQNKDA